jgi:hypothetical protein
MGPVVSFQTEGVASQYMFHQQCTELLMLHLVEVGIILSQYTTKISIHNRLSGHDNRLVLSHRLRGLI